MSMYQEMSASECQRLEEEPGMYYVEQVREVKPKRWEGVILESFDELEAAIRYAKLYEGTRVMHWNHGWHTEFEN